MFASVFLLHCSACMTNCFNFAKWKPMLRCMQSIFVSYAVYQHCLTCTYDSSLLLNVCSRLRHVSSSCSLHLACNTRFHKQHVRCNFIKALLAVAPLACVLDLTPRHCMWMLCLAGMPSSASRKCTFAACTSRCVQHVTAHHVLLICQHTQLACTCP